MQAIELVLARVDEVAERGARIMRAAALFTGLGAVAATLAVFAVLGWPGWLVGIVCLFPAWVLVRYSRKLSSAIDVDRIRSQLAEATEMAKDRIGEVVEGVRTLGEQPIRGGMSVLRTVRAIRSDLADFGVDVSAIAEVGNAGTLAFAALSLFAGIGLWVLAAVGMLVRLIF